MTTKLVKIHDPITDFQIEYAMEERLKDNLDKNVKDMLIKTDKDMFLVVDGREGCQPKGSKVLMSDGSYKNIENIKLGDEIISPQEDGTNKFGKIIKLFSFHSKNIYDVHELNRKKKLLYSCSGNHFIPINVKDSNGNWVIKHYSAEELANKSKHFMKNTTTPRFFPIGSVYNSGNCNIKSCCVNSWIGTSINLVKRKGEMVYGFTVDTDSHWYVTDNYTITKNSGKSTIALQIGKYVDPTLNLSRVVFSPDDFREAILKAKKGQCIVYDEAFTGFSSRSSLSPINRVLVSLAMQMRQKNLFIIIVLPTIFLLDKYIAMFRAKALIHVYENKGVRGYFKLYNMKKKKYLILMGSKTMSYNHKTAYTNFKGRFYGKFSLGDDKIKDKYLKKKEHALADSEKTSMSSAQVRYKEQRDLLLWLFKGFSNLTYRELSNLLLDYEFNMSFEQISKICNKFGSIPSEMIVKSTKTTEKQDKVEESNEFKDFNDEIHEEMADLDENNDNLE